MSKKMPSNNQNEVNLSQMINNINRGGNNISQNDIKNMDMLEKLSKPIKPRKMSTAKKIMIGLVSIAGIAALPIPLVMFMKDRKVYVTTIIDYNIEELSDTQIKYKKGSTVNDLQIMEVEGYRFAGWYADKDFTIRLSPDEQLYNTTIYARYVKQVKVNTIIDGKTFEHKLDVGTKIKDINIDNKPSMRFDGWYTNNTYESSDRIDENTIIDSDQTIYGRYIQQIQIDVYVDGIFKKELIKDKGVTLQEFESEIQQPNQTYKSFDGWYTDVACTNRLGASDPIESDEIIYGRYVAEQVTININIDGVVESTTANKGMTFGEFKSNLPPMDKQYYDFYGWYTTDAYNIEVDDSTKLLNEITIYGKYVLQQATITLNIEGEVARSVTLNKTTTLDDIDLESLGLGERNGYRFDGWYKNSARTEPWNDDDIFTSNITLYGKYIKQVNIQIFVDGQEKGLLTKDIGVSLQQLTDELKQPDKPYMTFDGWYKDSAYENKLTDYDQITTDLPIYGRYNNNTIKITLNIDGSVFDDPISVNQGSEYSEIKSDLPVPFKQYHRFDGWYTTADYVTKIDDATVLTEDLTLYGKFNVNKTTITLRIEGEEDIILENIDQGQKITDIDLESYNLGIRDGYRFSGWYADGDYKIPWHDNRPFEDDSCELYGKYTEILGIALIVENSRTGEKASQDYEYNAGDKVSDLPPITQPDNTNSWVFDGWYSDAEYTDKLDGSTTLEKGKSYYARFIQQFNIDILVEGEVPHAQMVSYNDTVAVLGDMSKSGYEFDGWYANDDYTGYLDANYTFTANGAVYGRYKPEITLVINGNNKIITVISGTTLEENPDKWESLVDIAGYGFRGWFSDINCNNSWATTTALTTPTTIYAKLVEQVTVSVYLNGNQIDEKTIDKNTLFKDVKDTINNVTIPTGYKFDGWYKDAEYNTPWLDNDEIDETYNIYGHYTIQEFTVTVNIDGEQTPITVNYGTVLSEAIAGISTSREGYRFDNWYTNDGYTEIADLNHKITSDYTVYGRFIDTVDVKVYLNGTELTESAKTIDAEMTFEKYKSEYIDISDKIPEGNKFDDWYKDSTYTTKWNNSDLITDDNNEIWGRYSAQYAIYTNIDGVTQTINLTELTFDSLEKETGINDHNSPGWYTDEKLMEPVVTLENNTTIYTKRVTAEMLDNLEFTLLGDSTYKVKGTSIAITGDIVIPRMYENKTVTVIDDKAFFVCASLQNITIPNSVTKIGNRAFMGTRLESIILPNKLITLGDECFNYCYLKEITIPNSVKSVGDYCFAWTYLTEIIIPSGVNSLGEGVFEWCQVLERITVNGSNTTYDSRDNCNAIIETESNKLIAGCKKSTIPDTVTSIGDYAFHGHTGLDTIRIPSSVTGIGIRVFAYCNLSSIIVDKDNKVYDSRDCNAIIKKASNELIVGCGSTTIPNTVISIGDYAFEGKSGLTTITIPSSVTSIGSCVFYDCSKLNKIIVATGNTVYDSRDNCNAIIETESNKLIVGCGLTIIPNSIIEIDTDAFNGVGELTSITIPNSVVKIGKQAFSTQPKLTKIEFDEPDGWYATKNQTNANNMTGGTLTDLSDAGANVKLFNEIPNETYYWYKEGNLPADYLAWDASTSSYYVTKGTRDLPSTLIIPATYNDGEHGVASVTYIKSANNITSKSPFANNTNLKSVVLPSTIKTIGDCAFWNCSNLTSITLPNGLEIIEENVFDGTAIRSIIIPASVISIAHMGYMSNNALQSIVVEEGNSVFDSRDNCNAIIETNTNRLIYGCTNSVIPNTVTSIGYYAFWMNDFKNITIPNSVTTIEDGAFSYTRLGSSITIPSSVTSIGKYAFLSFQSSSITFEGEGNWYVTQDETNWENKTGGTPVDLSDASENVTYLKTTYAIYYWYKLTPNLPEDYLAWDASTSSYYVTRGTRDLPSTLIIPATYNDGLHGRANVTGIKNGAFEECYTISQVVLPNTITYIEDDAFNTCRNLNSVNIPSSVTSIGRSVFVSSNNISSIELEDSNDWYVTQDATNWENKTGGTPVDLSDASANVTLFKNTYSNYYWYKIEN